MMDKLDAYKQHHEKCIDVLRQAGANDAFVAACEKANALSFALLEDIIDTIGKLDVALAEVEAKDAPPAPSPGFVDQHGQACP